MTTLQQMEMGQDKEGTIRVLTSHRTVIGGGIAFHQGRVVSTAGDSMLAEFNSAVDAVLGCESK